MFEILCFMGTMVILNNSKLGSEMFHYQDTQNQKIDLEIIQIIIGVYLLNSLIFIIYTLGLGIFIVGAYIYLKCNNSSFNAPVEDKI